MLYKNEESFSKAFKASKPQGIYLLFGSEDYLIGAWAGKIRSRVCGDGSAFNFQKLDGARPDIDLLFDATEAMPLMAGEKCVLLDGLDVSKLNASDQKKLEDIFADLNPACVMIVTCKPTSFDVKSAAAKKLIKLADKYGNAVELGSRGTAGLTAFLKSAAQKNGCEVSTSVCRYILQICENDMIALSSEMAKICAYAGGGELSVEHVDAVATPKIEARVFDLSKAVLAGNIQRAMEILSNLFYLREPPVSILAVLTMSYVDIYRARIARDKGISAAQVARVFGYKSEYRVQNAFSCKLPADKLRRCIECLYDCDLKMKSTGVDDKILLEKAVIELFTVGM